MTFSLEDLATLAVPPSRWWQCLHRDGQACIRLWCFPCVGAGPATLRPWVNHLAGAAEVMSVCLPGRETRWMEASLTRIGDLARGFADALAPFSDERDIFCGQGMTALLAFEVARRLRSGGAPRGLIVCGTRAPHHRRVEAPLHRLAPRDFLSAVERRYGPIPSEFRDRPEFLELLLPALRADLEVDETYALDRGMPLDVPILALAGSADPLAPLAKMLGWRVHTTSRFHFALVRGGHFFGVENPTETAACVREFLATL